MIVLGICGASGSGKTYLLKQLTRLLGRKNISIISQDNYYKPRSEQIVEPSGYINFDLPTALESERFIADFQKLRQGSSIHIPQYHYNKAQSPPTYLEEKPCPIVIIEGILIFYFEEIRKHLDYKIFVEADPEVCLERRLARDQKERGYQKTEILYRFKHHALPVCEKYVLPYRAEADFVIDNNRDLKRESLERILEYLEKSVL